MDPLIPVVVSILGLIAVNGILAGFFLWHLRTTTAERSAWQHERWELNTRLAAQSAPLIAPPVPLPTQRPAGAPPRSEKPESTELHLVGSIEGEL